MMAGTLTPTEVMAAWKSGADFVKIFPCGEVAGANYIRALRGPFPQVPIVPTGGVNLKTAADFILAGASALGVGGELVSSAALQSGNAEIIATNARKFIEVVRNTRNVVRERIDV
jgi:2-dehydro-3-deoxyphosphogluconate aldolase/(4S)-4-hydroxy-2-oxoglutarate aldolase